MAWVGGANEASGVSRTLTGALNGIADNIDEVATAAGVLVAVGAARWFGDMASGAFSATSGLLNAAKSEIALAEAQVRGTQISTARARAAVYRAQQALIATRGTDAQAAAEKRLSDAQASLTRNISARTAAQEALNNVTSLGSRLMGALLGWLAGFLVWLCWELVHGTPCTRIRSKLADPHKTMQILLIRYALKQKPCRYLRLQIMKPRPGRH